MQEGLWYWQIVTVREKRGGFLPDIAQVALKKSALMRDDPL